MSQREDLETEITREELHLAKLQDEIEGIKSRLAVLHEKLAATPLLPSAYGASPAI